MYIGLLSSFVAYLKGFALTLGSVVKVLEVAVSTTLFMMVIITAISAFGVFYIYKRNENPNNLVMTIMTSVADTGTILVFALFVSLVF